MPITGTELSTISTDTSAGTGDHGKIVLLASDGKIDSSMLPTFGSGSVDSVSAGTGIDVTGTTDVTISALYGTSSSTACVGNDTRLSDDRTASGLRTATTVVVVSTAAAPSAGQVLAAINSSSAHWVDPAEGTAGTTWYWYESSEVVSDGDGVDGDFAIIVAGPEGNGNIYQKVTGHWTAVGNIRGGDGIAGTQIRSGTTAPDDGTGVNGDFYMRTDTGQFYKRVSGTYSLVLTMQLALSFGTTAGTACEGNDSRLSDARTPTSHATSHKTGGSDAIKLDELDTPTDVTTLNATTSAHGLLRKLNGSATSYLDGTGSWSTPAGTGGGGGSSISGALPLYFHPASPHANDEEFESTTAPSGWELRDTVSGTTITPSGGVNPYSSPSTGTARASFHTDWRSSYASIQLAADNHNMVYAKSVTVPTNVFIWTRLASFVRNSGNAGADGNCMLGFFADSGGHPDFSTSVCFGIRSTISPTTLLSAIKDAGASTAGVNTSDFHQSSSGPWEYVGIHKIGTSYYCYAFNDAGMNVIWDEFTHASTMSWIGFHLRTAQTTHPAAGIHRFDFLREIDSATQLPF
jgi:hypothetical protein